MVDRPISLWAFNSAWNPHAHFTFKYALTVEKTICARSLSLSSQAGCRCAHQLFFSTCYSLSSADLLFLQFQRSNHASACQGEGDPRWPTSGNDVHIHIPHGVIERLMRDIHIHPSTTKKRAFTRQNWPPSLFPIHLTYSQRRRKRNKGAKG